MNIPGIHNVEAVTLKEPFLYVGPSMSSTTHVMVDAPPYSVSTTSTTPFTGLTVEQDSLLSQKHTFSSLIGHVVNGVNTENTSSKKVGTLYKILKHKTP